MRVELTKKGKNAVAKVRHLHKNEGLTPDEIAHRGVSTCVVEFAICTPSIDTLGQLKDFGYALPSNHDNDPNHERRHYEN